MSGRPDRWERLIDAVTQGADVLGAACIGLVLGAVIGIAVARALGAPPLLLGIVGGVLLAGITAAVRWWIINED